MDKKLIKTESILSSQGIFDRSIHDMKLISNTDVREWVGMKKAVGLMKEAFSSFALGNSFVPQRSVSSFPDIDLDIFYKPVFCKDLKRICIKLLTQKNDITALQRAVIESTQD